MKDQSELFDLKLVRLNKMDYGSLPKDHQAFFAGNLEESIASHLQKEGRQEEVSSKFSLLDNSLDIVDNLYIRVVGHIPEYYELKQEFGRVFMGDDLVVLINIRRLEQG